MKAHLSTMDLDAEDAIVKVAKTTICGTDLHILKGDVLTCTPGRVDTAIGAVGVPVTLP